ncbi:MAG: hypothetical protein D3926_18535 [Desulfobacteraceae bacterium]|nr:MAG: hypothetical protein D3926_18535 [Desulfobacteraceae bacterium]
MVPAGHAGAYQLFNQAVEASRYIDMYDSPPGSVDINWPASGSGAWYNGEIYITDPTPWGEPTLYHEYGHFIMDVYADLPTFDYCNGICDTGGCGHCIWHPETGYIHHMEGVPNFFADVQSAYWNRDDSYGFETHSATADTYPVSQRDEIEGITASILWDLYDSPADNQHNDNPRDNLSLGFDEIWNVTTNYDPGGPSYDYPMTIHQFWDGFYSFYPGYRQGLWSIFAEHHIQKDFTAPTNPTSVYSSSHSTYTWSNDRTIRFYWSGASDNLSGVDGYGIWVSETSTGNPSAVIDEEGTSHTTSSLVDGTSWYFHIRTADNAGNWNSGAVHRGPYYIDGTAPTGLIQINGGDTYTRSRTVTLNLSASDNLSGLYQMRFANPESLYSVWEAYKTTKTWTLRDLDGARRVYVQYKDHAGNVSTSVYDDIRLDRQAPTGSIVVNGGDAYTNSQTVELTLSASDSASGVSQMCFGNFGESWTPWETYGTVKTWLLKDIEGWRRVYVRFKDHAGNTNGTAQYYDAITLDRIRPTGDISINSEESYTNSRGVTLTLTADDSGSGVSEMLVANLGVSGSVWEPLTGTKAWELKDLDENQYVGVMYKDRANNLSYTYIDSIILDRIEPTGTVVINSGDPQTWVRYVTLGLNASDSNGLDGMRFSNNNLNWCPWEPFMTTKTDWCMTAHGGMFRPGVKTVYVQFMDPAGNVSTSCTDDIECVGGAFNPPMSGVLILLDEE